MVATSNTLAVRAPLFAYTFANHQYMNTGKADSHITIPMYREYAGITEKFPLKAKKSHPNPMYIVTTIRNSQHAPNIVYMIALLC